MSYQKISTGIAAILMTAVFIVACSEKVEVNGSESGDGIGIGVTVHQHWHETSPKKSAAQATRATQTSNNMATQVIQAEGTIGNEPVYLWCDEIKGIDGKGLSVEVEAAQDEATRGTLKSGIKNGNEFDPETFYDKFSIYGEKAHGGRLATWRHDNEWTLSSPFAWGNDHDYEFPFYGIAPVGAEGLSESDIHEHFRFTYDTPRNATKQSDIMVGLAEAKHSDRHIWFKFRHVLTAIKFKVGGFKSGYKITRVELEGIYKTNTYNLEDSTWNAFTGSEAKFGATTTAFSTVPGDGLPTDSENKYITSDSEGTTFIVLPQTVPGNPDNPSDPDRAYAIITLVPDGSTTPEYIRACISGIEWQEGHTYTYTISSSAYPSNYKLDVRDDLTFDYDGTAMTINYFNVNSYKEESDNSQTPKPWVVDGYMLQNEDGTWPDTWESTENTMLKAISTKSGDGRTASDSPEKVTLTIWHQKKTFSQRREKELQALQRTLASPMQDLDLSLYRVDNRTLWNSINPTAGRTTANCYIVRYGGTYKLPLVIGNCYQKGEIKSPLDACENVNYGKDTITINDAFGDAEDGKRSYEYHFGASTFVNYMGTKVTSSNCIINNAQSAKIFWHDFQHVETNDKLDVIPEESLSIVTEGGLQFLKFKVDEDLIQQGNAVLAVYDGPNGTGNIIWSWHIYITDRNWLGEITTVTNYEGHEFPLANYNLGYVEKCAAGEANYLIRKMKIRVYQPEGGLYGEVIVTQNGHGPVPIDKNRDWDTKYQWGRKDAMPGTVETGTTLGTYFPTEGYEKNGSAYKWSGTYTYADAIKNPGKRYASNSGTYVTPTQGAWSNSLYSNAWSATNSQIASNSGAENYISPRDDRIVVKTIYDPCPPGFCMPPSAAFTGFAKTKDTDATGGNRNISGSFNSPTGMTGGNGYSFYSNGKNGASSGTTIFFPATGRNQDGGSKEWGNFGFVWSATPGIPGYSGSGTRDTNVTGRACGYHLSFKSDLVRVVIANVQMMPQSVRPMEDIAFHGTDIINHEDSDVRPYEDNDTPEVINLNN